MPYVYRHQNNSEVVKACLNYFEDSNSNQVTINKSKAYKDMKILKE